MKLRDNKLLLLTDRYQNYEVGILNQTDVKYRMMLIDDVNRLLENTPCSGDQYIENAYVRHGVSYGGLSDVQFDAAFDTSRSDFYSSGPSYTGGY